MKSLLLVPCLALAACASAPADITGAPVAHAPAQPVCVVSADGSGERCPEAAEAPPDSDEDCTVIEPSDSLNHAPPKVHAFCATGKRAGTGGK